MIQLNRTGLTCDEDLASLRVEFDLTHTLRLPQLLHPDLVRILSERLRAGAWTANSHGRIGEEVILDDQLSLNLLHFVTNTKRFLALIREVTGMAIERYTGRIYRMVPGANHYDDWHDDIVNGSTGMSINLGARP
jgi:hypothetical protein